MPMKSRIIEKLRRFADEGFDPLGEEMQSDLGYAPGEEAPAASTHSPVREEPGHFRNPKTANALYIVASVLLCAAMIVLLLYNVSGLPSFGGADTLTDSEVGQFYIENSLEDTGATNIVTSIILSYRGFDTLGESHVLFIALCAVLILLRYAPEEGEKPLPMIDVPEDEPAEDEILTAFGRILLTLIFVFGLYIIFNGNTSPGGGFSGGAVIGAGCILYLNVYGHGAAARFLNVKTVRAATCAALVCYTLFKGYHFLAGFNGLENIFTNGTPGTIFSGGMMLYLNVFVGAVVSMTMYSLFIVFRRGDF